ncbi:hypothetical protein GQ53DRAFT_290597 [Thozetella sp. PMI_491]|nr:hypothetical protein GQ53DRAFT_290597 [Thozetella sp. PMI_491]
MEVATGPSSGSHLTGGRLRNPGGRPRNSRKTHRSSLRRIIPAAQPGAPATRHLDFPYAPEPPILVDVPGSGGPHTRDKSNWRPPSQQPPSQGDTLTGFAPCLVSTEIHGGLDDILEPISPPPSSQSTQDNDSTASQSPAPLWSPSAAWTSSSRGNRSSRHTARARQAQMSSSKPRRCYPYDITEKDTGSAYRWIELDVLGCDNSRRQVKAIIDPHTKRNLIRGRVVHELNYCPLPIAPKDSRPLLSRLVGLVQPNTFLEVVVQATTNPVLIRSLPMYVFDEREDTEAKGDWDIILKEPLKDAMAGERGDGQHLEQVTVDSLPYGITWGCGAATARTSTSDYMDAPSDHEMPTSQFVPSSCEFFLFLSAFRSPLSAAYIAQVESTRFPRTAKTAHRRLCLCTCRLVHPPHPQEAHELCGSGLPPDCTLTGLAAFHS